MKKQLLTVILLVCSTAIGLAQVHRSTQAGLENRFMERGIEHQQPDLLQNNMEQQRRNPTLPSPSAASEVQLMDSIYHWSWDTLTTAWSTYPRARENGFIYDSNNNLLSSIYQSWDGSAWGNFLRYTYTYSLNNNELSSLQEIWDGSAWGNAHRETYTYDSNNNQLSKQIQNWNVNVWVNFSRLTYTYDSNNNQLSYLYEYWDGSAWSNSSRYTYTYNPDNNLSSILQENWYSSAWVNSNRWIYTYDPNNNLLSQLVESWDGSAWSNSSRYIYTYDTDNNRLSTLSESWDGSAWVNFYRDTSTYDPNNNPLSQLTEYWDGSTWGPIFDNTYTYDGDNFQESHAYWHWESGNVIVGDSTHYYYHSVTGIREQVDKLDILAYPNPSTGLYQIEIEGINEYHVLDALCREVKNQTANGNITIDLTAQPSGIYILHLLTDKGWATQKLMKE